MRFILAAVSVLEVLTTLIVTGYGNSYLLKTLDAPSSYPAFAFGVYGFVKLATAPVSGWLTDRMRPAASAVLAATLQAGGVAVMLAVGTANGFVVGIGILSAGTTLVWLLVFRALADSVPPNERGRATAHLGLISVISIGIGFGAAAILAESASGVVFTTGMVLGIVSALLLRPAFGQHRAPHLPEERASRTFALHRPARTEMVAGTVVFMHFLAVNGTIVAFSPFALDLLDLTLLKLGVLLAPAAAAGGLAMLAAGRRSRHGRRLRELLPLYALGAAALLLTALTSHWAWFALGMACAGVTIGGATPRLNSSRIDLSTDTTNPGQVLGGSIFAEGLGSVVGPMAVGVVVAVGDIRAGALAAGVAFAMLAVLTSAASRTIRL